MLNKFLTEKGMVILIAVLVIASFIVLATIEQSAGDMTSKDTWILSFENPKNDSLVFVVENFSNLESFHWSAVAGKDKPFAEGDVFIPKGSSTIVSVESSEAKKKITIRVSDGKNKKEIYKNFE